MVVELRAYGDESGTHYDPSYCVVSGWIGSPRQWRMFETEWNTVLEEYEISEFHSKDFFGRKQSSSNPYRNWDRARSDKFIIALADVIARRRLYPVGGAVDVKSFMSYSERERRFMTMAVVKNRSGRLTGPITGSPNKPYHLAVPLFLTEAAEAAKDGVKVHFVFDRNDVEQPYVHKSYDGMKDRGSHPLWERLGQLAFDDRRDQPGLQAADLLTHLWWSFLEYGAEGMGDQRHQAWQPLKKRRDWMRVASASFFDAILDKLPPQRGTTRWTS